jgi:putative DNA methylase
MIAKSFLESDFPIKEVSAESVREKNIRHGHISTLHIWWTRKPLSSSRATIYAGLIPAPKNEEERLKKSQFIAAFTPEYKKWLDDPINKKQPKNILQENCLAKWENSLNERIIKKAREEILKANNGKSPKVLDPFAGGGSIPLEALRLGCETYASDLNPVAVLILKCTLEYPQKYGRPQKTKDGWIEIKKSPLLEDVKKWGNWVLEEAKKEIARFYPNDEDGSIPVGYYWMRTIPCQNPSCGAEILLTANWWLAKKDNRKITLKPIIKNKKVEVEIVGQDRPFPKNFEPGKGTVSRAIAHCLVCGSTFDDNTVRKLFQQGKSSQRMVAVVLHNPRAKGKTYRVATENDLKIFKSAEKYLEEKRKKLMEEWGIDPVPDEPLPPKETLGFRVQRYGILKWGDLFNSRQKLALITFTEKVRLVYKKMIEEGYDKEYARAVVSYLGFIPSRMADTNSTLCHWDGTWEKISTTFARQALPMNWDYIETNVFSDKGYSYLNILENNILNVLFHLTQITPVEVEENENG